MYFKYIDQNPLWKSGMRFTFFPAWFGVFILLTLIALPGFAQDTTPPEIVCPSDRVITTNDPDGRVVFYNLLSVVDIEDPSPQVICTSAHRFIIPSR
jgi:hypothetical protein